MPIQYHRMIRAVPARAGIRERSELRLGGTVLRSRALMNPIS